MEHSEIYCCHYDGELRLQVEEIDDGKWLGAEEMDQLVADKESNLTDVLRMIWQIYQCL